MYAVNHHYQVYFRSLTGNDCTVTNHHKVTQWRRHWFVFQDKVPSSYREIDRNKIIKGLEVTPAYQEVITSNQDLNTL